MVNQTDAMKKSRPRKKEYVETLSDAQV